MLGFRKGLSQEIIWRKELQRELSIIKNYRYFLVRWTHEKPTGVSLHCKVKSQLWEGLYVLKTKSFSPSFQNCQGTLSKQFLQFSLKCTRMHHLTSNLKHFPRETCTPTPLHSSCTCAAVARLSNNLCPISRFLQLVVLVTNGESWLCHIHWD